MYSKFDLKISDDFYNSELSDHLKSGQEIYKEHENTAQKSLREFIYKNGHIDGTSMKNHWFQMEDVDVFLSHSHQDINKIQALAGWLYDEFGLTAFIDSCVWGYCDDLLKEIDDNYCKNGDGNLYAYALRNYTTSHVHIMLSTALTEMMDKTECIMFYNTPNSISLAEDVATLKKEKKKVTLSPWIYHELAMTSLLESKPKRKKAILESVLHKAFNADSLPNIEHEVGKYLNDMEPLKDEELRKWKRNYHSVHGNKNVHALDVLYTMPFMTKEVYDDDYGKEI
ncbi:hypothetical protein [Clostridium sp.]